MTEAASSTPIKPTDILTPDEAADLIRIPVRSLSNFRTRGGGPPYIKIGHSRAGRVFYRRDLLLAWFAAQERCSTTQG